jgi:hypothetical protein
MITAYLDEPLLRFDPPACFYECTSVYCIMRDYQRFCRVCIHFFRSSGERARLPKLTTKI